ncbi:hypothetical protein AOQ84DRAFT_335749 [Glonium stellatum]|uniref:Poly(A) RNA polymerase mitochondrial-like central palm domain-containing protein n=1 Tax=Glonium stellatum TaxID=574774 RepID=A0A8E2F6N0_9PEZI|nr:hypothetical protein AOQ84DRAFT_335749 [Glonium stellatum]
MHLTRHGSVCFAHNAFRPATVLWQQFVLPSRSFLSHQRCFSTTHLKKAQTLPSGTADGQQIKYPHPESVSAANKRQIDDIHPDDLPATLKSHRASNRATIIRTTLPKKAKSPAIQDSVRAAGSSRLNVKAKSQKVAPGASESHKGQISSGTEIGKFGPEVTGDLDPMLAAEGSKANLTERGRKKIRPSYTGRTFKRATELLEYEGQNVLPILGTVVADSALPWVSPFDSQSLSGLERLSLELSAFHSYMMPTPDEQAARERVIRELRTLSSEILPDYQCEVFGSERTGLALAISDVDLRLHFSPSQTDPDSLPEMAPRHRFRKQMTGKLAQLNNGLQKSGRFILCYLRNARYPLISAQHQESGLDIQIVGSNDTSISRIYIKKYVEQYPGLRELFTTLKVMFDVRGLSDVFRGGLGSYSIFMMAVASLVHAPHVQSNDLSQRLLTFLNFWSTFDTYKFGLSIEPAEMFAKNSKLIATKAQLKILEELNSMQRSWSDIGQVDPAQPYLLCLQDPADATNDLGKKAFGIKHVQATFKAIEKELKKDIQENQKASLLAPLVGCSYALFKERREKLEDYGKSK